MATGSPIGRLVRYARRRAGMTQRDLGAAVGMPQPSIARIENGAVLPRTATLLAILEATGHELAVEPRRRPTDRESIRRSLAAPSVPHRTWRAIGRAAKDPRTSPLRILRRLRVAAVPFVLIGDLAEVAHGAPMKIGRLVEICHPATDAIQPRMARALGSLNGAATSKDGRYKTEAGELRLVTETVAGDDYNTLVRNAVRMHVDAGILVQVAALEDLIRIRRARGTPQDRAAAAVLRAIGEPLKPS